MTSFASARVIHLSLTSFYVIDYLAFICLVVSVYLLQSRRVKRLFISRDKTKRLSSGSARPNRRWNVDKRRTHSTGYITEFVHLRESDLLLWAQLWRHARGIAKAPRKRQSHSILDSAPACSISCLVSYRPVTNKKAACGHTIPGPEAAFSSLCRKPRKLARPVIGVKQGSEGRSELTAVCRS